MERYEFVRWILTQISTNLLGKFVMIYVFEIMIKYIDGWRRLYVWLMGC